MAKADLGMSLAEITHEIRNTYGGDVVEITDLAGLAEVLLERGAEKVTAHLSDGDYKVKRAAELKYIREAIDQLERAYQEELLLNEEGIEPVYELAPQHR